LQILKTFQNVFAVQVGDMELLNVWKNQLYLFCDDAFTSVAKRNVLPVCIAKVYPVTFVLFHSTSCTNIGLGHMPICVLLYFLQSIPLYFINARACTAKCIQIRDWQNYVCSCRRESEVMEKYDAESNQWRVCHGTDVSTHFACVLCCWGYSWVSSEERFRNAWSLGTHPWTV